VSAELKKRGNGAVYISGSQTGMLVPLAPPEVIREEASREKISFYWQIHLNYSLFYLI
jgi:hypothetical protein